jgi:hypothetical protein
MAALDRLAGHLAAQPARPSKHQDIHEWQSSTIAGCRAAGFTVGE